MRIRQFSIVYHNIDSQAKPLIERHYADADKVLVAIEPYKDQEGFHAHVFVKYSGARSFKAMLSNCQAFSKKIVVTKPEGEERDWGRVQVDQMRGSFEQATKYLTAPDKEKEVDPNVVLRDKERQRFLLAIDKVFETFYDPLVGRFTNAYEKYKEQASPPDYYAPFFQIIENYYLNKYYNDGENF